MNFSHSFDSLYLFLFTSFFCLSVIFGSNILPESEDELSIFPEAVHNTSSQLKPAVELPTEEPNKHLVKEKAIAENDEILEEPSTPPRHKKDSAPLRQNATSSPPKPEEADSAEPKKDRPVPPKQKETNYTALCVWGIFGSCIIFCFIIHYFELSEQTLEVIFYVPRAVFRIFK